MKYSLHIHINIFKMLLPFFDSSFNVSVVTFCKGNTKYFNLIHENIDKGNVSSTFLL